MSEPALRVLNRLLERRPEFHTLTAQSINLSAPVAVLRYIAESVTPQMATLETGCGWW